MSSRAAERRVNFSESDLFDAADIVLIRSVATGAMEETMGGMAFCPSNHRNKVNIYERTVQLFKWDVLNSSWKAWYVPPVCV